MLRSDFDLKIIQATRPAPEACNGLITVQVALARDIWTEILTHRLAARNASSRRAMSGKRIIGQHGAWIPGVFYASAPGMSDSGIALSPFRQALARVVWRATILGVEVGVRSLGKLGVAKQQANRLLTGAHVTNGVITMTEAGWRHFFSLRNHPAADRAMIELLAGPLEEMIAEIKWGRDQWHYSEWHLPFWPARDGEAIDIHHGRLIAVARIARVSYGEVRGKADDLRLAQRLISERHASPFEHLARFKQDAKPSALNCLPEDRFGGGAWETYRAEMGL